MQFGVCTDFFASREITSWCTQPGGLQNKSWRHLPTLKGWEQLEVFSRDSHIRKQRSFLEEHQYFVSSRYMGAPSLSQPSTPTCLLPAPPGERPTAPQPSPPTPLVRAKAITPGKDNERAPGAAKPVSPGQFWRLQLGLLSSGLSQLAAAALRRPQPRRAASVGSSDTASRPYGGVRVTRAGHSHWARKEPSVDFLRSCFMF